MAIAVIGHGRAPQPFGVIVGRIETSSIAAYRSDTVLLCRRGGVTQADASDYAAVLTEDGAQGAIKSDRILICDDLSNLHSGDLVLVDGNSGRIRTLFLERSQHNALFLTERCNNNCLMCSQPPRNNGEAMLGICMRMVELLKSNPPVRLGITGGEPTLLGEGFLQLLSSIKTNLPTTAITSLSNGRRFADQEFACAVAALRVQELRFSVPIHADVSDVHDHIAQASGAFNETIAGLYNLAALGVETEIRIVLHALSIPRLESLAEWIWRKLPFVRQVAFMGLENMGYVKKNWSLLWIDPIDYSKQLRTSVEHLHRRGIAVSLYNLPYCVLPEELWGFACNSISDHKHIFLPECKSCDVAPQCAGFFQSGKKRHSRALQPIHL
jgi:His-Xaa-Ser system radical SAM maturase HxsC